MYTLLPQQVTKFPLELSHLRSPRESWGGEHILSSFVREWLQITDGLPLTKDPVTASRSLNKLMCVIRAERRQVVGAQEGSKTRTKVHVGMRKNQSPHKTDVQSSKFCSSWLGMDLDRCMCHINLSYLDRPNQLNLSSLSLPLSMLVPHLLRSLHIDGMNGGRVQFFIMICQSSISLRYGVATIEYQQIATK